MPAKRLSTLARQVLEASAFKGKRGKKANVRGAAAFATKELARRVRADPPSLKREKARERGFVAEDPREDASAKRVDANRRLLDRLAYRWRKGERLQEPAYNRAWNLLNCLTAGGTKIELWDTKKAQAWHRSLANREWIRVADGYEVDALLDRHARERRGVIGGMIRARAAQLLPAGPLPELVLGAIEVFRKTAEAQGHEPLRVHAAIQRFLAPFCAHGRTEGIERAFHELSRKEQKAVVHNSLAVEKAWLGNLPSRTRIWALDAAIENEPRQLAPSKGRRPTESGSRQRRAVPSSTPNPTTASA